MLFDGARGEETFLFIVSFGENPFLEMYLRINYRTDKDPFENRETIYIFVFVTPFRSSVVVQTQNVDYT